MEDLLKKIAEVLPTIKGWCVLEKAEMLARLIVDNRPSVCVEIGVFAGSSLIPQALALQHNAKGIVYGIDAWCREAAMDGLNGEEHKESWGNFDYWKIYREAVDTIERLQLTKHCKLIHAKAGDLVGLMACEFIDMLHIDGNHSAYGALSDLVNYYPRVKTNGIVCVDDVNWRDGDAGVVPIADFIRRSANSVLFDNGAWLIARK